MSKLKPTKAEKTEEVAEAIDPVETTPPLASEPAEEITPTDEVTSPPTETEEDYLNFSDDDQSEPSETTIAGTTAAVPKETVLKADYDKVVSQFNALNEELNNLKAQLDHPLVQAGIRFIEAQDSGVEIDPGEFIRSEFGVDVNRMSDEDVLKEIIKNESKSLGVKLSSEDIDEEFDARWSEIQNMSNIRRMAELKKMRGSLEGESKEKLKTMIDARQQDILKAQEYWTAQVKRVDDTISDYVTSGRKDYGLKMNFDGTLAEQVKTVIANNYIRYKKDGSVDEKHAIEVALFAADPKAYIKRIESVTSQKAQAESLKMRSAGSLTNPSTVPSVSKELPTDPSAWDPRRATPIGTIKY